MRFIFFFSIILLSCNNSEPVVEKGEMGNEDSLATTSGDTIETVPITKAKAAIGVYETTLPCADCKGIRHIVAFNTNQRFQLQEEHLGKSEKAIVRNGSWKITDSLIWLYEDQIVAGRYKWNGDSLMFIDVRTDKAYSLTKLASARENKVWSGKKAEGLEFFGIGNEPFWSIEIDDQDSINFQLSDWPKALAFKSTIPQTSRDSTVYKTVANADSLHITIYNQFCSDGMSDFIYDNEVKVSYNGRTYKGCGLLYK